MLPFISYALFPSARAVSMAEEGLWIYPPSPLWPVTGTPRVVGMGERENEDS